MKLRPLECRDLEKVNSVWPYRSQNSLEFSQRLAELNPNVGAFTEDGTLVAWVFRQVDIFNQTGNRKFWTKN